MIHFFQSNQTGAPQLSGQPGTLTAVLNACLVTGFNLRTLTTLTREGTVATATSDTGHGFREHDLVQIAGATDPAYNGLQRIRQVTTNSFQFDIQGNPTTPATGSLTAKLAPMGWESPFVGENKVVYRAKEPTSNRLFLRIDETPLTGNADYGRGPRTAAVQMWEQLNDLENGTGMCSTWWRKAQNASAIERPWVLVGDQCRFWLLVNWSEAYAGRYIPYFFGDIASFKAGDAYGALLGGYVDLNYNGHDPAVYEYVDYIHTVGTPVGNTGLWLARGYPQLGGPINAHFVSGLGAQGGTAMGLTSLPYPNAADNGIYVMPVLIQEKTGPTLRGRLPGLLSPLQAVPAPEPTLYEGFVIDGTVRKLLVVTTCHGNGNGRVALDLTGPWH